MTPLPEDFPIYSPRVPTRKEMKNISSYEAEKLKQHLSEPQKLYKENIEVVDPQDSGKQVNATFFVSINKSTLGDFNEVDGFSFRAAGGCHVEQFSSLEEAKETAIQNSQRMIYKFGSSAKTSAQAFYDGLPYAIARSQFFDGSKCALHVDDYALLTDNRIGRVEKLTSLEKTLLEKLAKTINKHQGEFCTGTDVNWGGEYSNFIIRYCPFILGYSGEGHSRTKIKSTGNPGEFTAELLFRAGKRLAGERFDSRGYEDLAVLINGAGNVGSKIALKINEEYGDAVRLFIGDTEPKEELMSQLKNAKFVGKNAYDPSLNPHIFFTNTFGQSITHERIGIMEKWSNLGMLLGSENGKGAGETEEENRELAKRLLDNGIWTPPESLQTAGGIVSFVDALGHLWQEEGQVVRKEDVINYYVERQLEVLEQADKTNKLPSEIEEYDTLKFIAAFRKVNNLD